jgi:fatty-acyl-CoA synthase
MFHSLGLGYMLLMSGLGSTIVLRRRFDPTATLDSIERHHSTGMVLVPVMLQRMVGLGEDAFASRDLSSLTAILVSGSQLGSELATRALELFGPVVHNLYGSTEVAYATIATPADLIEHPTTVGKVCLRARLRILDEQGREVPTGTTGRVFVRNAIPFDGYTGGGHKEVVDGLMSSGDVGHLDADGRLFIDGRDDEMLVSGGENLFPREVEETLEHHPEVDDVACVGVPDESFGERLRAFVVRRTGSAVTEDELRAFVKENLAGFKVPREVVFLDELPRTATGKVLKRELRG